MSPQIPPKPAFPQGAVPVPPRITLGYQHLNVVVFQHLNVVVQITRTGPMVPLAARQQFTFSICAINAGRADGGVPLKNVIYNVWVENPSDQAHPPKLIVPSAPAGIVTRNLFLVNIFTHAPISSVVFDPGLEVGAMCVYPAGYNLSHLDPGETETIDLTGKAPDDGRGAGGPSFLINAQVIADSVAGDFVSRFSQTFALAVV